MKIKKIVAIGPESTGKSTLCAQLAEHYNSLWVPEYAREYLEKIQLQIAKDVPFLLLLRGLGGFCLLTPTCT